MGGFRWCPDASASSATGLCRPSTDYCVTGSCRRQRKLSGDGLCRSQLQSRGIWSCLSQTSFCASGSCRGLEMTRAGNRAPLRHLTERAADASWREGRPQMRIRPCRKIYLIRRMQRIRRKLRKRQMRRNRPVFRSALPQSRHPYPMPWPRSDPPTQVSCALPRLRLWQPPRPCGDIQ